MVSARSKPADDPATSGKCGEGRSLAWHDQLQRARNTRAHWENQERQGFWSPHTASKHEGQCTSESDPKPGFTFSSIPPEPKYPWLFPPRQTPVPLRQIWEEQRGDTTSHERVVTQEGSSWENPTQSQAERSANPLYSDIDLVGTIDRPSRREEYAERPQLMAGKNDDTTLYNGPEATPPKVDALFPSPTGEFHSPMMHANAGPSDAAGISEDGCVSPMSMGGSDIPSTC